MTAVIAWQLLNGMSIMDPTSIIEEVIQETVQMYSLQTGFLTALLSLFSLSIESEAYKGQKIF